MTFSAVASGAASSAASTPAPNDVQAGVLGFLVVAAIGIVLVFLLRSMSKHLRKIGPKPDDEAPLEEEAPMEEAVPRDGAPPPAKK